MTDAENITQAILNPGMKPTMRLRWHWESVCHLGCPKEKALQQYWQDETGAGEWRDIKEEE